MKSALAPVTGDAMAATHTNQRATKQINDSRSPAEAWRRDEHAADAVAFLPQELTNMAGTIDLATDGLRSTVEPLAPDQKCRIARRLGYESWDALIAASMVMMLDDGSAWCLTPDRSGAWVAWNVCAFDQSPCFTTKEEALAAIQENQN
jgi:hypothetical protein